MNQQTQSQKQITPVQSQNKVSLVQKAVSQTNSQQKSQKNKSQFQFQSASQIPSSDNTIPSKNRIKSQYEADKQNTVSQTSNQEQQIMNEQAINQLKKLYGQFRQFKLDKQNKLQVINPKRIVVSQVQLLWKKRALKSQNFILNLYLEKVNQQNQNQKNLFIQMFKCHASVNLYINGQKIQNKQAVHFSQGNNYYEGIEKEFMMITKTNGDIIDYYEGQVKDKLQHGEGSLMHYIKGKTAWQYIGQFVEGKRQGNGKQVNSKGITYQGQFKNDFKHGKGLQVVQKKRKNHQPGQQPYVIKSTYQGQFQYGFKQGIGNQITPHGQYQGEWHEGVKSGKGKIVYKNGHSYEGEWANNSFSGQGVYIEAVIINGEQKQNRYQGEFKDGYYHGKGVMMYANGDKYDGQWIQGKKQGAGMYQWADGDYYDGQWQKDSAQGTGAACFNSVFYDGQFHLGQKHGLGEQSDADGNTIKAIWQNNQILKKLQQNGQIIQQQQEQK